MEFSCPKCGSFNVNIRHRINTGPPLDLKLEPEDIREWLRCGCIKCGYLWDKDCKDSKKNDVTE